MRYYLFIGKYVLLGPFDNMMQVDHALTLSGFKGKALVLLQEPKTMEMYAYCLAQIDESGLFINTFRIPD